MKTHPVAYRSFCTIHDEACLNCNTHICLSLITKGVAVVLLSIQQQVLQTYQRASHGLTNIRINCRNLHTLCRTTNYQTQSRKKSLIFYTCYVDDIFIIYDQTRINYNQILHHANSIHSNLLFNITQETETYRKPTSTDTVIHITSNHPHEHKLAAFRLLARMHQLPLTPHHHHPPSTNKKNGLA